jgi:hypothetical protein
MTEPKEVDWEKARHLAAVSSWAAQDIEAIATIIATAKAEERAAVAAYLREQAGQWDRDAAGWFTLNTASVMIERGEHRRGEER